MIYGLGLGSGADQRAGLYSLRTLIGFILLARWQLLELGTMWATEYGHCSGDRIRR